MAPLVSVTGPSPRPLAGAPVLTSPLGLAASGPSPSPKPQPWQQNPDALLDLSQRLQQKVSSLEGEMLQLREERDSLRAENQVIGEHVFGLQKENGMLHDIGMNSFLEKTQWAQHAEGVGAQASKMREESKMQQEHIEALTNEGANLRSIAEALQGDRAQLQCTIRSLEANMESVQADLSKRISRESELDQRCADFERQLDELGRDKARMDETVAGQHLKIANLHHHATELQEERARSHALTQKLETAQMEISRCYQEKASFDQLVSTLHVESAQLMTQRDSALAEVPHLQSALQQQGAYAGDLERQVAQLQHALNEAQRRNAQLDKENTSLSYQLEKARQGSVQQAQAMASIDMDRAQLRDSLDGLGHGKAEVDSHLSTVVTEKGLLQAHLAEVTADKEQLQLRVEQGAAEIAALRSRTVGLEKTVQGFQDEAAALHERVRALRSEREELQERCLQHQQPRSYGAGVVMQVAATGAAL